MLACAGPDRMATCVQVGRWQTELPPEWHVMHRGKCQPASKETMSQLNPKASVTAREILRAWGKILAGDAPLLSIEITRECPLSCPGCYAYGDAHLGGGKLLSELNDFRGAALVEGVLGLVRKHRPMHVSLVGGEPLIRHRELSAILPALSAMNVFTLVVTSGIV